MKKFIDFKSFKFKRTKKNKLKKIFFLFLNKIFILKECFFVIFKSENLMNKKFKKTSLFEFVLFFCYFDILFQC